MKTKVKGKTVRVTMKNGKVYEGKCRMNTDESIVIITPMIPSLVLNHDEIDQIEVIEPIPFFKFNK